MTSSEAAKWADVVMVLSPDEGQAKLYNDHLKDNLREKYVVTLADEHRAAEIMEAFRD